MNWNWSAETQLLPLLLLMTPVAKVIVFCLFKKRQLFLMTTSSDKLNGTKAILDQVRRFRHRKKS
jgi:hypothetical protein